YGLRCCRPGNERPPERGPPGCLLSYPFPRRPTGRRLLLLKAWIYPFLICIESFVDFEKLHAKKTRQIRHGKIIAYFALFCNIKKKKPFAKGFFKGLKAIF